MSEGFQQFPTGPFSCLGGFRWVTSAVEPFFRGIHSAAYAPNPNRSAATGVVALAQQLFVLRPCCLPSSVNIISSRT